MRIRRWVEAGVRAIERTWVRVCTALATCDGLPLAASPPVGAQSEAHDSCRQHAARSPHAGLPACLPKRALGCFSFIVIALWMRDTSDGVPRKKRRRGHRFAATAVAFKCASSTDRHLPKQNFIDLSWVDGIQHVAPWSLYLLSRRCHFATGKNRRNDADSHAPNALAVRQANAWYPILFASTPLGSFVAGIVRRARSKVRVRGGRPLQPHGRGHQQHADGYVLPIHPMHCTLLTDETTTTCVG